MDIDNVILDAANVIMTCLQFSTMNVTIVGTNQEGTLFVLGFIKVRWNQGKGRVQIKLACRRNGRRLSVFNLCDFRLHFSQKFRPGNARLRRNVTQRERLKGAIAAQIHGTAKGCIIIIVIKERIAVTIIVIGVVIIAILLFIRSIVQDLEHGIGTCSPVTSTRFVGSIHCVELVASRQIPNSTVFGKTPCNDAHVGRDKGSTLASVFFSCQR
mmetsp:Transcript_449/g.713  ORF Transcript_449/g.713 Transcript_449/m.713 type:complete len:213 (+) Transcript_449:908-1546(+)